MRNHLNTHVARFITLYPHCASFARVYLTNLAVSRVHEYIHNSSATQATPSFINFCILIADDRMLGWLPNEGFSIMYSYIYTYIQAPGLQRTTLPANALIVLHGSCCSNGFYLLTSSTNRV